MRKAILLTAVMFFLAATASSQIKSTLRGGLGLGSPVSGELPDYWKNGLNFGGSFGIRINPSIEISARLHYNSFPADKAEFKTQIVYLVEEMFELPINPDFVVDYIEFDGAAMKLIEFGVDVRIFTPVGKNAVPIKPYWIIGVSTTSRSLGNFTISFAAESKDFSGQRIVPKEFDASFCFGAGFNIMFSPKTGMYIEGRYITLMAEPEHYGWLQVTGGVSFEFGAR